MKRILSMILAILSVVSLVACSTVEPATTQTGTGESATTPATGTVATTEEEKPLVIPENTFSVGYARVDITPTLFPVPMGAGAIAKNAHDPLYLTCIAVADGDEVALLFHADLKRTVASVYQAAAKQIERDTGITADHILITATHTHNGPEQTDTSSAYIVKWMQSILYPAFRQAAKEAYQDLSAAKFYGGTADTTGYAFVRRYMCADGSHTGLHHAYGTGSPAIHHETEADPELQVMKITREGKKDIVMVNWQAHVAHAASTYRTSLTADFVHYLRAGVEGQMGVQFAYYNGACGNINLSTKFPELVKYSGTKGDWVSVGKALVAKVKEAYDGASTELQTGEIKVATGSVTGVFRKVDPTRLAQAKEYNNASEANKSSILAKYKFQSKYEASKIVTLGSKTTESEPIPLYAITFGDIAFAGAPYEMFDTSGMEIKKDSPAKMTFICSCTNGSMGYLPSTYSYSRGGYEVDVTSYVQGTAELCVAELLRLINTAA